MTNRTEHIIDDLRVFDALQHLARESEDLKCADPKSKKAVLCTAIRDEIHSGNYNPAVEYFNIKISGISWRTFTSTFRPFGDPMVKVGNYRIIKDAEAEMEMLNILVKGLTESPYYVKKPFSQKLREFCFLSPNTRPSLRDLEDHCFQ